MIVGVRCSDESQAASSSFQTQVPAVQLLPAESSKLSVHNVCRICERFHQVI
jgi:hypothetical protein